MGEAKRRKVLDPTFGIVGRPQPTRTTKVKDKETLPKQCTPFDLNYEFPSGFVMPLNSNTPTVFSRIDLNVSDFYADECLSFDEFLLTIREACFLDHKSEIKNGQAFRIAWQAAAFRLTGDSSIAPESVKTVSGFPALVKDFREALFYIAQKQGYYAPLTESQFDSCFWDVMTYATDASQYYEMETIKANALCYFWEDRSTETSTLV